MPVQKNTEPEPMPQDAPELPEVIDSDPGAVADEIAPDAAEAPEETNVVRYIGVFSERTISREDWEKAGVSDQEGVTWTKSGTTSIPIEAFTEEALRVLSGTGEFQIIRDQ